MKKILKNRIFIFVLGFILATTISVVAANLNANTIGFEPDDENWNVSTVEEAINDLYISDKPILVWTNPNPNVNFVGQTVSINLSEYKYIMIVVKANELDSKPRATNIVPVGQYNITRIIGTNTSAYRDVTATTTGVTFTDGSNLSKVYNDACIPYKIYGIKGELGIDIGISE